MKRVINMFILLAVVVIGSSELYAGSIDYLINQSAEFVRIYNRNGATEGADLVHYNPAATAFFQPGFSVQASNQVLLKYYTIEDSAGEEYESNEPTLLLPNIYAVYNGGKWAGFCAFTVTAGGGSLVYDDGLPVLTSAFTDIKVEGSSMYLSGTLGGAYAFNDMISVSLAAKYVYGDRTTKIEGTYLVGSIDSKYEYEDTAHGFGGVIGVDIKPMPGLNIGLRFESEVALEFETEVDEATGAFASYSALDGEKTKRNLPAVIGLGVEYKFNEQFKTLVSFQGYMIGWADEDDVYKEYDSFGWEAGIGFEYAVMPKFLVVSIGYLYTKVGGNEDTYNDLEYALDCHTVGLGGKVSPMPNLDITLGLSGSFYVEGDGETTYGESLPTATDEKFNKIVYIIAIGAEYRI